MLATAWREFSKMKSVEEIKRRGYSTYFKMRMRFGRMIGITLWAGDNRFGCGEIEQPLEGYKTWRGQVTDQDEA